ncbi:hypothetical protein FRC09_006159 [Ceratobasidium sp. 395]|nr:hypothetical protein FRC09_006159 [Ceratobasidium sp. 395]
MAPPPQPGRSTASAPPDAPRDKKRKSQSQSESGLPPNTRSSKRSINTHPAFRRGTSQLSRASSDYSHSDSRAPAYTKHKTTNPSHTLDDGTTIAAPEVPKQSQIDALLKAEMEDAIFCDPNFIKNFLTVDSTRLKTALERCKRDLDNFRFPTITKERQLYEPLARLLSRIRRAVNSDAEQSSQFLDVSSTAIPSHGQDTAGIKPDLVLFDDTTQHWETVRMPIEVKTKATHLKVGMKQLTRYARAVFANQLHRRHLYGMVMCKWAATFVRFDRSGILYSTPIDIRSQNFREAFAGLMMLSEEAFGYDTAFTTRSARDGRLEYYVDLPAAAFPAEGGLNATAEGPAATPGPSSEPNAARNLLTKRLKVMRTLCHRKSIRGRATIVLRVREVINPGVSNKEPTARMKTRAQTKEEQSAEDEVEVLGTRDYVLKLMWRDPNKKMEGEVLERLVGIYGVAQHMWHSDVFKQCKSPNCTMSMDNSCGNCLDKTPDKDELWVAENFKDLDVEIPEEADGDEETVYKEVDTDKYSPAYARRTSRTYCRLLMSTVGSPLHTAGSPSELLQSILDAVLGYWRMVNMGLLHRDISDGNVLILREGHGYRKQDWKLPQTTTNDEDSVLARSERFLQEVVDDLGRDPTGMLNDFDLSKTHNLMGVSFFGDSVSEGEESNSDPDESRPKRRKLDPETNISSSSKGKGRENTAPKESSLNRVIEAEKGARCIDFRTGTPTYMSTRVLQLEIGQEYEHHFMDDLESFFWLILWCVVEHLDSRKAKPSMVAYRLLDELSKPELRFIALTKVNVLRQCSKKGIKIRKTLAACTNAWASDPAIVSVIVKLGSYFDDVNEEESLSEYTPDVVFPMFVGIILDALKPQ